MKVVAGTITDGGRAAQFNAGDVITVDATKTYAHVSAKAELQM